jgi:hypothetical protein
MLLCNNTHNLSFADAQIAWEIACEISLRKFFNSHFKNNASNSTPLLRHAIDVEAADKTRFKVLLKYFVL